MQFIAKFIIINFLLKLWVAGKVSGGLDTKRLSLFLCNKWIEITIMLSFSKAKVHHIKHLVGAPIKL